MSILNKISIKIIFTMLLLGMVSGVSGCSSTGNVSSLSKLRNISSGDDDKLINEFTISTSPGMTLNVKCDAGGVKVKPGSGSEVRVKVYGDDETYSKVEDKAEKTPEGVEVTSKIKDEYKNNNDGWNLKLRYEIEVPSSYNVKVKTGGGSVSVADLTGTVNINTGGGAVSIESITGDVAINTGGGSIKVNNNSGELAINTGGGAVKLSGFSGNVAVNTGGGSVSMEGSNGLINVVTGGGSISLDYSGTNRGISLSTGGGSISLEIPVDFAADLDLYTGVGSISTDFGKAEKNGMSSSLKTTINGGGDEVVCHTGAGSIRVSKK